MARKTVRKLEEENEELRSALEVVYSMVGAKLGYDDEEDEAENDEDDEVDEDD